MAGRASAGIGFARRALACAIALVAAIAAAGATAGAAVAASPPALVDETYYSPAVAGTLNFRVYLPTGYADGTEHYPVLYVLNGLPNRGTNWRMRRLPQVGAIAEAAGRPAIVVGPQASRPGDTDPEFHDWGPGRDWETAIASDLVNTVDSRFRTIASRGARGLIGISAGGYGAAIIAVRHSRTFSFAQSWSGYFYPTNPAGTAPLSVGNARANRRASVHSYVRWLARTHAVRLDFYTGDRDHRFVADNVRLHHQLARAHVAHRFAIYAGGHSSALWGAHQQDWVTAAVQRLTPAG